MYLSINHFLYDIYISHQIIHVRLIESFCIFFIYEATRECWTLMIGRTAKRRSILVHRPNAMRHLDMTLSSLHDSFYLSHLSRSPSSQAERVRWSRMEFRRNHLLFLERAQSARRLLEFAIKKIDAMEGISPAANLLLFHSALGLPRSFVIH